MKAIRLRSGFFDVTDCPEISSVFSKINKQRKEYNAVKNFLKRKQSPLEISEVQRSIYGAVSVYARNKTF